VTVGIKMSSYFDLMPHSILEVEKKSSLLAGLIKKRFLWECLKQLLEYFTTLLLLHQVFFANFPSFFTVLSDKD